MRAKKVKIVQYPRKNVRRWFFYSVCGFSRLVKARE